MPTKKPAQLPETLRYLQPFANALAKLPPEDLNEDVDTSRLDAALRKRVRGVDEEAADAELAKDRDLLERWLTDKPDHPAHWIRGFLLSPELATHLTQPAEAPPRGPEMFFEAPAGWKVKTVPFRLDLKAGKVIGSIMAIDELTFAHLRWQREQAMKTPVSAMEGFPQPKIEGTFDVSEVSYEQCSGKKYLSRMTSPAPWKQVDYILRAPGGFVSIGLGTVTGVDFDESPLESRLHTLRLSASA
ncbi:MAG: hypothetical protein JWM57_3872 [Phycisphaerales bacterium]|nr:hypothetical protein [Phycisphaerales bacterium]